MHSILKNYECNELNFQHSIEYNGNSTIQINIDALTDFFSVIFRSFNNSLDVYEISISLNGKFDFKNKPSEKITGDLLDHLYNNIIIFIECYFKHKPKSILFFTVHEDDNDPQSAKKRVLIFKIIARRSKNAEINILESIVGSETIYTGIINSKDNNEAPVVLNRLNVFFNLSNQ